MKIRVYIASILRTRPVTEESSGASVAGHHEHARTHLHRFLPHPNQLMVKYYFDTIPEEPLDFLTVTLLVVVAAFLAVFLPKSPPCLATICIFLVEM